MLSRNWTKWLATAVLVVGATGLTSWAQDIQIQSVDLPYVENLWKASSHADKTAAAFNDWNTANPPVVPTSCAKCHSSLGYQDFLGADGSAVGVVDKAPPVGTTIDCMACHNAATETLSSVTFPSGAVVKNLGAEARCMVCHQGRESKVSVDAAIKTNADPNKPDVASTKLSFINVHYAAAGATLYAGLAQGGYQYAGKAYNVKFAHVDGMDTCIDCHDQHSLEIRLERCVVCHTDVKTKADLKNIRMMASLEDYDGDGDVTEGIAGEIAGLQAALYKTIQAYATKAGAPIVYDANAYPYFFKDKNGNGQVDPNENVSANKYVAWTPRLLKAAYNYQFSIKDKGAFAHNAKYVIQLLFDSIQDLDATAVAKLTRDSAGHFAGSDQQWRHWDAGGKVDGGCSKCHSATGLPFYLQEGVTASQPLSNGLMCSTCHDAMPTFTRRVAKTVAFPSGAILTTGDLDSNLCINCHQGRESTVSVNAKIAGLDLDTVSSKLGFINVHYFAAGATLFGTQAKGAYEYAGKTYLGQNNHVSNYNSCVECHEAHTGEVKTQGCSSTFCHGTTNTRNIRKDARDFNGNGNKTEGLYYEVAGVANTLYTTIQSYAKNVVKTPIVYSPDAYPYFFIDTNGDGKGDPAELVSSNAFKAWTPRLLCAAYNLHYFNKDPGAYAHNGKYMIQVLFDSITDLGTKVPVDMSKMVRP